jgi:hypothetical protein
MTGNVAQVFLDDDEWAAVLLDVRRALRPRGHLVLETRRPEDRAWERWRSDGVAATVRTPSGLVARSLADLEVSWPFVSFSHDYDFPDGTRVTSSSTLRFRSREEVEQSLDRAGFSVVEVRDAPDRPGREYVFIATKREASVARSRL